MGITALQAIPEVRERRRAVPKAALTWLMMSIFLGSLGSPARAFTAYNCSNRSNILKSYSLLEPDTGAWLEPPQMERTLNISTQTERSLDV
jgi:hypothetical protein